MPGLLRESCLSGAIRQKFVNPEADGFLVPSATAGPVPAFVGECGMLVDAGLLDIPPERVHLI
jgi:hypothetical protein